MLAIATGSSGSQSTSSQGITHTSSPLGSKPSSWCSTPRRSHCYEQRASVAGATAGRSGGRSRRLTGDGSALTAVDGCRVGASSDDEDTFVAARRDDLAAVGARRVPTGERVGAAVGSQRPAFGACRTGDQNTLRLAPTPMQFRQDAHDDALENTRPSTGVPGQSPPVFGGARLGTILPQYRCVHCLQSGTLRRSRA